MKSCPICSKKKEKASFTQPINGKLTTRTICNYCGSKMNTRLSMLTNADMAICKQLGLDFMSVTDYEEQVRKKGKFHRDGIFS